MHYDRSRMAATMSHTHLRLLALSNGELADILTRAKSTLDVPTGDI